MGLLRMAARTAVVAGTATAVSGRIARRQARKYDQEQAQYRSRSPPLRPRRPRTHQPRRHRPRTI